MTSVRDFVKRVRGAFAPSDKSAINEVVEKSKRVNEKVRGVSQAAANQSVIMAAVAPTPEETAMIQKTISTARQQSPSDTSKFNIKAANA